MQHDIVPHFPKICSPANKYKGHSSKRIDTGCWRRVGILQVLWVGFNMLSCHVSKNPAFILSLPWSDIKSLTNSHFWPNKSLSYSALFRRSVSAECICLAVTKFRSNFLTSCSDFWSSIDNLWSSISAASHLFRHNPWLFAKWRNSDSHPSGSTYIEKIV